MKKRKKIGIIIVLFLIGAIILIKVSQQNTYNSKITESIKFLSYSNPTQKKDKDGNIICDIYYESAPNGFKVGLNSNGYPIYLVDKCAWALYDNSDSSIMARPTSGSNKYSWENYYKNSKSMQSAYSDISKFYKELENFKTTACTKAKESLVITSQAMADDYNNNHPCKDYTGEVKFNQTENISGCSPFFPYANNGFVITKNSSDQPVYLVDRCAWGLYVKDGDSILTRTDKQWESYYNNSTSMKYVYSDMATFKNALNDFKKNACLTAKDALVITSQAMADDYNNNHPCKKYTGAVTFDSSLNHAKCDVFSPYANETFDVQTSDKGYPLFLVNRCAWDLYTDSNSSILARPVTGTAEYSWENYYKYNNTMKLSYPSFSAFKSALESFKYKSCGAQENYVKSINDINLTGIYNESLCVTEGYSNRVDVTACSSSESSVAPLSFKGQLPDYEARDYIFYYKYDSAGSYMVTSNCEPWDISAILKAAQTTGELEKVCNYFNGLYQSGLLDSGKIYVLDGTFKSRFPKDTSLQFKDVSCSAYINFNVKNENNCTTKYTGDGRPYFVNKNNYRISKEHCENITLDSCSTLSNNVTLEFNSPLDDEAYANGLLYNIGYNGKYCNSDDVCYPVLAVNGCDSYWDVESIATKITGGCDYLKDLASKGFLSKEQIEDLADSSCVITPNLVGCNKFNDTLGNSIYSYDGYWMSENEYQSKCNSYNVYFDENGGYGLHCDNGTVWHQNGVCKTTGEKNKKQLINAPMGTELWKKVNTNTFIGWSTDPTCQNNVIEAYNFEVNLTSDKTYYACYLNNDPNYTGEPIEETSSGGVKHRVWCDYLNTNNDIKDENEKSKIEVSKVIQYKKDDNIHSYDINKYCSISCTEKFKNIYPSTFQTVKSGTYFEFMFDPETHGTRTCTTIIDYWNWKQEYNTKLEDEYDAYETYVAAKDTYDSLDAASDEGKTCRRCSGSGESRTCTTWEGYRYRYKTYTYNSRTNQTRESNSSISSCGSDPKPGRMSTLNSRKNSADTKLQSTISSRKNLEKNNRQCYTALDNTSTDKSSGTLNHYYQDKVIYNDSKVKLNEASDYKAITTTTSAYDNISSSVEFSEEYIRKGKSTAEIYDINPVITFRYDDGDNDKIVDTLQVSYIKILEDTGAYTNEETLEKNKTTETITKTIGGVNISFDAYTATLISRRVKKYIEYKPSKMYYVDYTKSADGRYTTTDCPDCIEVGYVYPVTLSTKGAKNVAFGLSGTLGHKDSLNDLEAILDEDTNVSSDKYYKCTYNVTNDVILEEKDRTSKYKANFYIRSVESSNIDPNDRLTAGTLGRNWASDKGQALIKKIEEEAIKVNTFSPDYLDYSITLTPESLREIVKYNETNSYDDFNLECNSVGGECESDFITNYVKNSMIDGVKVDIGDTMSYGDLQKRREAWKYFLQSSPNIMVWTTKNYSRFDTSTPDGAKKEYERDYQNTGVLP